MIGVWGMAERTRLKRPMLGVVPPPTPRLPHSSRRSAPPRCALRKNEHENSGHVAVVKVTHAMADSTESMQTSMVRE